MTEKCCWFCFSLEAGMKIICGVFFVHGLLNLQIAIIYFSKGAPMAWRDLLMVPPQWTQCVVMIRAFKQDGDGELVGREERREKVTKGILIVNIVNTVILALCVLWMIVHFDSAFPIEDDFDTLDKSTQDLILEARAIERRDQIMYLSIYTVFMFFLNYFFYKISQVWHRQFSGFATASKAGNLRSHMISDVQGQINKSEEMNCHSLSFPVKK